MNVEDLRLLNAALTAHENWLYPDEVRELHDFRRQVEVGWALSEEQRRAIQQMVKRSRTRREQHLTLVP
jgi:hypothetical protein